MNCKKWIQAILTLCYILSITSCSLKQGNSSTLLNNTTLDIETTQNQALGLRTYRYMKENPFYIGYPIDFQVDQNSNEQIIVAFTHPIKEQNINVVIASYRGEPMLFIQHAVKEIQAFLKGATLLTNNKITSKDQTFFQLIFRIPLEEQVKIVAQYSLFRDEESVYIITFTCLEEEQASMKPIIKKVLESFHY